MTKSSNIPIISLLCTPHPDLNQIIDLFITEYNTSHGSFDKDRWNILKDDWQRYEFLGDSVLNLVIAKTLLMKKDPALNEGEMTKIRSSIVSNKALDLLLSRFDKNTTTRIIPLSISEQNTYGERITGGSFEAFIGALYGEVGLEVVECFINSIMKNTLDSFVPDQNYIGIFQEKVQKKMKTLPEYEEIVREGPDHKPLFTFIVRCEGVIYGKGSGESKILAKQAAAKIALDTFPKTPD